jgi:hypothetical protein
MQVVGIAWNRLHWLIFSYVNKYKALAVFLKSSPNISVNLWSQLQRHDDINPDVTSCGIYTVQFLLILPVAAKIKRCCHTDMGRSTTGCVTSTCRDVIFDVKSTVYSKNLHVREAVVFDSKGCNSTTA